MSDLLLSQSTTVREIPGDVVLSANGITDPEDLDTANWQAGGIGPGLDYRTLGVAAGPFGPALGYFQNLFVPAPSAVLQVTQFLTPYVQRQCFSVYCRLSGTSPRAEIFQLEFFSSSPGAQQVARFAMDALGVITLSATFGTPSDAGVENVGEGVYRCWVGVDVDDLVGTVIGTDRSVRLTLGPGGASGWNLDVYGPRLDEGTITPLAHTEQLSAEVSTTEELDLVIEGGDLVLDLTLQTPVLVSLFSDARAQDGDADELGEFDRRGAWFDSPVDRFGSRLWLLSRRKVVETTLREAETWAREGLEWLIRDGIAAGIEVSAADGGGGLILLEVAIVRGSAEAYPDVWRALEDAALDSPGVRLRLLFR